MRLRTDRSPIAIVAWVGALALAAACASSSASDDGGALPLPERLPSPADAAADVTDASSGSDTSVVAICANARKDGDETDVDCGGATCPPCGNARTCSARRDCKSLVCSAGKCSGDLGCSDGTREGYASTGAFPNIAACAGAWSIGGLLAASTKTTSCQRAAGNDGPSPAGSGCNVADLCQPGWHVCETSAEVGAKSAGSGCAGAAVAGSFFVTRQSGPGGALCGTGANDLFGCGGEGAVPDAVSCAPLDRFSGDLCAAVPTTWVCGSDGFNEANNVTKTTSVGGGVLCCRD